MSGNSKGNTCDVSPRWEPEMTSSSGDDAGESESTVDAHVEIISGVLFGLTVLLLIVSLPPWFINKRRFLRTKKRSTILTMIQVTGIALWLLSVPLRDLLGRDNFSCDVLLWAFMLHVPFIFIPLVIKLVMLRNKLLYAQVKALMSFDKHLKLAEEQNIVSNTRTDFSAFLGGLRGRTGAGDRKSHGRPQRSRSEVSLSGLKKQNKSKAKSAVTANMTTTELAALRFRRSWAFVVLLWSFTMAPFLIAIVAQYANSVFGNSCLGCSLSLIELLVPLGFVTLAAPIAIYYARDVQSSMDPLRLTQEIEWGFALGVLPTVLAIVLTATDPGNLMYGDEQKVNWLWIEWVGIVASFFMQVPFQVIKAIIGKEKRLKFGTSRGSMAGGASAGASAGANGGTGGGEGSSGKRNSAITPGRKKSSKSNLSIARTGDDKGPPGLEEVLESRRLREAFEQHLVAEFCHESLLFVDQVRVWRTSFDAVSKQEREHRAKQLYDAFIPENSLLEVNISDSLRASIEQTMKLAGTEEGLPRTTFDRALAECEAMLMLDSLPRFLKSKEYARLQEKARKVFGDIPSFKESIRASVRMSSKPRGSTTSIPEGTYRNPSIVNYTRDDGSSDEEVVQYENPAHA